jgi:hypothetical protein
MPHRPREHQALGMSMRRDTVLLTISLGVLVVALLLLLFAR